MNNFKIKYDGLQTMWVYKDHTNPKNILNQKTIVLYKKGSMIDFCIGRWKYEPTTFEKLTSLNPITIETVTIKNPKIRFYIDAHNVYYKKDREKCFVLANQRIKELLDNATSSSSSDKSSNKANSETR